MADNNTSEWFFQDSFTIDPTKTMQAWETLTVDQAAMEIAEIPAIVQDVLSEHLRKSTPTRLNKNAI